MSDFVSPCHQAGVRKHFFGSPERPKVKFSCRHCGQPVTPPGVGVEGWRYATVTEKASRVTGRAMPTTGLRAVDPPKTDVTR